MKCGELGFLNADGLPCGQNVATGAKSCLWHDQTPKGKRRADLERKRGGLVSRGKGALPPGYAVSFPDREAVVRFVEDLAKRALTEDVELRRIDTALRAASVALTAHGMAIQERMVEALLRLEHGGTAIVLLERMQASLSTGTRRPLPGRLVQVPTEESSA
ncbi:MAG: hypothetical protein ACYDGR_16535 [Candidatus Dormibacteria bacterium]